MTMIYFYFISLYLVKDIRFTNKDHFSCLFQVPIPEVEV